MEADIFKRLANKSVEHERYFGKASKISSCILKNRRTVLIGGSLIQSDDPAVDWENSLDFLVSYLKTRLDSTWFALEKEKPEIEQHEIIKWYYKAQPNIDKNVPLRWHKPNGSLLALLHLSYDLYVMDNMGKLLERLINRIKDKNNFNGARYEAFMFATLIRAGLHIEFEDETSGEQGRVTECKAKYPISNEHIFAEVKTRNIKGVLGAEQGKKSKIKLYNKLKDAAEKNPKGPYVVFIDLNLPELTIVKSSRNLNVVRKEYEKLLKQYPDLVPNLVVFTNIPFHYGKKDSLPNDNCFGFIVNSNAKFSLKDNTLIEAIMSSIKKYSFLPTEF